MKIVAISDQHGFLPDIPACDLLIVAGDNCPDIFGGLNARQYPQLQAEWFYKTWLPWRRRQPAQKCVVTFGNHDWCGQKTCMMRALVENLDVDTHLVVDCEVVIDGIRIHVTPWSNEFNGWAWMKSPDELRDVYAYISESVDVLVSHQPPVACGTRIHDLARGGEIDIGSVELGEAIDRVKPDIVICGHVHGAYGKYTRGTTDIYNVSIVNEQYRMVNAPTEILWPPKL